MKTIILLLAVFLTACATPAKSFKNNPTAVEIYEHINQQGQDDAIHLLRNSFMMKHGGGFQDPGMPIRNPAVIVPVYVVGRNHEATDEKIEGHWKHLVIEDESWAE